MAELLKHAYVLSTKLDENDNEDDSLSLYLEESILDDDIICQGKQTTNRNHVETRCLNLSIQLSLKR